MDANDEALFRQFVDERSFSLRRSAYALTGDMDAAEDLVQDALTKLVRRWHKVDDPESYVRRIIYNSQISRWRRRSRISEDAVAETPERRVRDATTQVNLRIDLAHALLRLGPRQRAVLVLRYYEDLPERDVAGLLGCSVGTVRSQAARGLARLRALCPELSGAESGEFTPGEEVSA